MSRYQIFGIAILSTPDLPKSLQPFVLLFSLSVDRNIRISFLP